MTSTDQARLQAALRKLSDQALAERLALLRETLAAAEAEMARRQ